MSSCLGPETTAPDDIQDPNLWCPSGEIYVDQVVRRDACAPQADDGHGKFGADLLH
ncbi:MAG: hypothetical protein ACSHX3_03010 [Litorimonas sp.]